MAQPSFQDVRTLTNLLTAFLPPEAVEAIHVHVLHPHSPFQIYKRHALMRAQQLLNILYPLVRPLADRALALAADNQGAVGLIAVVALLSVVLFLVTLAHRVMMWCTRMAMRAVFYAGLAVFVAWACQRGVGRTVGDVLVWGGRVYGFAMGMASHWAQEYDRYDGQEKMAGRVGGGRGRTGRAGR